MNYNTKYWFSLLLAAITVALRYAYFGLYFQDSEKYVNSLLHGDIATAPTSEFWFTDYWLFHIPLLSTLAAKFESFPVYGTWHLMVLIGILSLWFFLAQRVAARQFSTKPVIATLASILVVWSMMSLAYSYIYNLRDAILFTAVTILLYVDIYVHEKRKSPWLILLFVYACTYRVSISIVMLFSMAMFVLVYFKSIKQTFHLLKFHTLAVFLLLIIVEGNKKIVNNPAMKIEQRLEYALQDRGARLPLAAMKTREDSIRYLALVKFFLISDSAQLNVSFINQVVDPSKYFNYTITANDFLHLQKKLLPILDSHHQVLILLYAFLLTALLYAPLQISINVLFFQVINWLTICLITMKISMFDYFFEPWLVVITGASIWMIMAANFKARKRKVLLAAPILLYLLFANLNSSYKTNKWEHQYNIRAAKCISNIAALTTHNQEVILWDDEQFYYPSELFNRDPNNPLKKCVYQNLFFFAYYKFGQDRMQRHFDASPLNWRQLALAFHQKGENCSFVMRQELADFLPYYYNELYGLSFVLTKQVPEINISPNIHVYKLAAQ